MIHQKRSAQINLGRMRKVFAPKPLSLGVASIMLTACGDNREQAMIFTNLQDCVSQMPEQAEQCELAYRNALEEAQRTAPKYAEQSACEYEFGAGQCTSYRSNDGNSWFMPFMAGYMLSNLSSSRYYSSPVFTSYSRYSPYRYRWISADGYEYGDIRKRRVKVSKKAFSPKPTVSKTIKRGGFGSSVRAKSSWGSSRGGWGG
ncbi:DUF1190 domain-containing protein [Alteromonas sp. a30]|nr:DUF1190 domain-containing protein [Alteromonas sp. a30]